MKYLLSIGFAALVFFAGCQKQTPETQPAAEQPAAVDESATVKNVVTSWLSCWENKDLAGFSSHMSQSYMYESNTGTNPQQDYAERLETVGKHFKDRASIRVGYENLTVSVAADSALASYVQQYTSDKYTDKGMKELTLKKENGTWRIVRDKFTAIK